MAVDLASVLVAEGRRALVRDTVPPVVPAPTAGVRLDGEARVGRDDLPLVDFRSVD